MVSRRSGIALCEVLIALVLLTLSAAWALQAAAVTERALGHSHLRADAMQRARLALADLQALPCDSMTATRSASETRWRLTATRTADSTHRTDVVTVHTRRGDTIQSTQHRWCAP